MKRIAIMVAVLGAALPARAQETAMVPVQVDGETVRLEMRFYKPTRQGRVPTLVFNHGSTGRGDNVSLYTRTFDAPAVARFFVERGWAVVMPQRRGRGASEGRYAEGLDPVGARGYVCDTGITITGADRALRDVRAAMDAIRAMPFVDARRMLIGGISRGGILSIAYAGAHPEEVVGVVNFVGGWMGTACGNAATTNQSLFERGARFRGPTLWLYGDRDPFYSLAHSRANFAAFTAAGGKGVFHEYPPPPGRNGHAIASDAGLWSQQVDDYLKLIAPPPVRPARR